VEESSDSSPVATPKEILMAAETPKASEEKAPLPSPRDQESPRKAVNRSLNISQQEIFTSPTKYQTTTRELEYMLKSLYSSILKQNKAKRVIEMEAAVSKYIPVLGVIPKDL
jgi:hypothetical protein